MAGAYYNEHDPFAAAWLRELIADNLIAPGEVDERSIEDVTPDDLRSFQQCHFFAGIGVWSLAARRAGIPDDAPLWTGSCPCQPFSAAGKGEGFADERHLWPAFHYLIEQFGPPVIAGEQVTGADGDAWFDLVSADLDATAYAFGVAETVACGFGAPHKRSRNYWVAHRLRARLERHAGHVGGGHEPRWLGTEPPRSVTARGIPDQLADGTRSGRGEERPIAGGIAVGNSAQGRGAGSGDGRGAGVVGNADGERQGEIRGIRKGQGTEPVGGLNTGGVANADGEGRGRSAQLHDGRGADQGERGPDAGGRGAAERVADADRERGDGGRAAGGSEAGTGAGDARDDETGGVADAHGGLQPWGLASGSHALAPGQWGQGDEAVAGRGGDRRPGPTNGLWADPDWLLCRDERWRAVEPGTFPLVDAGAFRNRVGLLRGAGNAVTLGQAEGFLIAVIAAVGRWW